jgi:hypothetical protein
MIYRAPRRAGIVACGRSRGGRATVIDVKFAPKPVRIVAWTVFAIVVGVPVALYLFAFAVNLHDEQPTAAALEIAAIEPTDVADADNGYVFLLGFGAARDTDPAALGAERAAALRELAAQPERGVPPDQFAYDGTRFAPAPGAIRDALLACSTRNPDCAAALDTAATDSGAGLADYRWEIDRYRTWLGYRAWREFTTGDLRNPFPPYQLTRFPRFLFWLETWQLAAAGDAEQVRDRLNADLQLWRLALAEADSLVGKGVAASFIAEHFEWGNLILRRLPLEQRAAGVPPAWRAPLTNGERSLRRALAGEWRYRDRSLRYLKTHGLLMPLPPGVEDPRSAIDRLMWRLEQPLLQPQASANRDAAAFTKLALLLDAPYADLGAALAHVGDVDERPRGLMAVTYNVLGHSLVSMDPALLGDYGARVADLEGVRRAALLAADLRGLRAAPSLAGTMIPLAAARDPYTGGPFVWTAEPPSVSFTGLMRGAQARHDFPY